MKKYNKWLEYVLILGFFSINLSLKAQDKQYKVGCVAFYNLENLFDTIDSENTNDYEFTPEGPNAWKSNRYIEKLNNMAGIISQIGDEYIKGGPAVLGVSEIENREVLEDLIKTDALKNSNYDIVHYNSPDKRGVDVALLYRKQSFKVTNSKSIKLTIPDMPDFYTRDILLVSGEFDGEIMHFMVNHWPSRRGGEKRSAPLRNAAGALARKIIDSLMTENPQAKIVLMGDLNDNPTDPSVTKHLKAEGDKETLSKNAMFNTMAGYYKRGIGTTAYQDVWSLFDQLIISQAFLNEKQNGYRFLKSIIFKRDEMIQKEGNFKGYPLRTFVGGEYIGGFSDHFPVYIFLVKDN